MVSKRQRDDYDESSLRVHEQEHVAAGPTAVAVSMKRALERMGPSRTSQTLLRLNQAEGFDCMSCAWPDPDPKERHAAEFCENGAKAVAEEATKDRATPEFFAAHSIAELDRRSEMWLGQQGRITHPMVKRPGGTHYEPISWDDAFSLVAAELNSLETPDAATFYTSGRTSNEAAFVYQLFVRAYGTNNLPDCSNMCHESTSVALQESIGIGKASVTMQDVYDADLIVIMGQNPGTNHPRMLSALEIAKGNGATIATVNPLHEAGTTRFKNPQKPKGVVGPGTALEDLHLPIRINGDLALLQALGSLLVSWDALDHEFIAEHTTGFEAWAAHVGDLDWELVTVTTGLTREQITGLAEMLRDSKRTVFCWAMGITQHRNGVATIKEIVNLALAQGNIGRPGAGLLPVRGHSNVQGDRTMGIWERTPDHFLDAVQKEFGFDPPREHGHDVVDSIRAMRDGKVSVFMGLGGNFVQATPDSEVTAKAHGELLADRPGLHQAEPLAPGVRGDRADPAHPGPHRDRPAGQRSADDHGRGLGLLRPCLPRTADARQPAAALRGRHRHRPGPGHPGRPARHRLDRHARGLPDDPGARLPGGAGVRGLPRASHARGGFVLPHPPRDSRTFETGSGKAEFFVSPVEVLQVPDRHLVLQTLRSHDQFNTTIYGLSDRYRGIEGGRRVVLVHREDIAALGFVPGDMVDLVSRWDDDDTVRCAPSFRVVEYDTPRGCAAAYYPETNPLVPLDSTALQSNTPVYKSVIVTLVPEGTGFGPDHAGDGQDGVGSDWEHKADPQPHHLS